MKPEDIFKHIREIKNPDGCLERQGSHDGLNWTPILKNDEDDFLNEMQKRQDDFNKSPWGIAVNEFRKRLK